MFIGMPHNRKDDSVGVKTILIIIFLPACVALIFSIIQKTKIKSNKTMSDKNFTLTLPNIISVVGAMCAVMSIIILLLFTFLLNKPPHTIFYIAFGLFFWLGMYLIVKTLTFKVIVKDETITVFLPFRKTYSFNFSEITSVVRQTKKNRANSERIIIKTTINKKLIVESGAISYKRFVKKIQIIVDKEYLKGF
ncbi:MAG: hypothetical protein IKL46_07000 [Clostridia bacterium]|nr:hypothetical protein [Clostridia bacterium]